MGSKYTKERKMKGRKRGEIDLIVKTGITVLNSVCEKLEKKKENQKRKWNDWK